MADVADTTPPDCPPATPPGDEQRDVPRIIRDYTLRIRSIHRCASEHIRLADDAQEVWMKTFSDTIVVKEVDGQNVTIFVKHDQLEEMILRAIAPHSNILSQSLLIFGFSTFDAFVGMLLRKLYRDEPTLIYKLDEKSIKVSELVKCKSIDEVINNLCERDISALLRNSYDDLFSSLASRHGLNTIKQFDNWPRFVEAAQRRNLITHCNGVANSQYIDACKTAGFKLDSTIVPGHRLTVDASYLRESLDILYEVGVKLGHTLWRKSLPAQFNDSEEALAAETFDLLSREEWGLAKIIGEFAVNLAGPKQDLGRRISRINYAQSLKWSGDNVGAQKILNGVDWSASTRDLRLGVEVLRDHFDAAADLMRDIGKKGELVVEVGYRTWPVFREFRKTPQFKAAFKDVYGKDFTEAAAGADPKKGQIIEGVKVFPGPPDSDKLQSDENRPGEMEMPPKQPPDDDQESSDGTETEEGRDCA